MSDVSLAFDPSSSVSKGLYTMSAFELRWIFIEPEVATISLPSIEQYLKNKIGSCLPENEAWVTHGLQCYAVGHLARTRFYSDNAIRKLKCEGIVPKVLSLVGAIAVRHRLKSQFTLSMGLLLPYGEYSDRLKLEGELRAALSNFSFCDRALRVKLELFNCMPEGAGVLLRGMKHKGDPKQIDLLVVMVGYRNCSYLLMEKGELSNGQTSPLGMVRLMEKIQQSTSGFSTKELLVPVTQAGAKVLKTPLKPLLRRGSNTVGGDNVNELVALVKKARLDYWQMLSNYLEAQKFPKVDEVILAGGTAHYLRDELEQFFEGQPRNWATQLESKVAPTLGAEAHKYPYRLTDVYGYFWYLQYQKRKLMVELKQGA